MFGERGFEVINYDPFFAPDREPLSRLYDFVVCSETLEHMYDPGKDLKLLYSLLKPEGWLGIQTQFFDDPQTFPESRYQRDPTHVCLYSTKTFQMIQTMFPWILEFPGKNLALFQKKLSN